MYSYILRRLIYMVLSLLLISVISFVVIQLPPGDFLTSYIAQLSASGAPVQEEIIASLRVRYGLDQPVYIQYFRWILGIVTRGDMGESFLWKMPVKAIISIRLPLTMAISLATLIFTYTISIPIGVYSATHQYSSSDYLFTTIGFLGIAIPNFLFALVLMYIFHSYLGWSVGGLFSPQYAEAPWSFGKFMDFLKHLPIPMIVIGTSGTAGLIRVMRACMLDELQKPYVITARAKGLPERILLYKYPFRIAINPILSSLGWLLPSIVSGETITSIVLGLPTMGPVLFRALISQDMYLAGSIILILSSLVLIGTFLSDILLALADPRIRYT